MKKMKRYNGEDDQVTSDGKDYGGSSGTGDYAPEDTEAKGEGMLKGMRDEAAKPKMMKPKVMAKTTPKPTPVSETKPAAKPDVTKMSLSERAAASRESARSGSGPTDTRSVSQRLRAAFGMKSGGSASSRADGIASRGKTRGKMC